MPADRGAREREAAVSSRAKPARLKRPTLRDIADETGLSSATVSYALRGLQVPIETQQRVREVADRLGYQADPIARALASGRTGNVGVLCGSLQDIWQQGVAAQLGRALLDAGLNALIVDATNDPEVEAELAQRFVDQRVDALICLPIDPGGQHWRQIAERVALISIGDGLPDAGADAEVVFDNAGGVSDALTQLADAGHVQIAVLTPSGADTPDRPAEAVVHRRGGELRLKVSIHTAPHDLDGATAVALEVLTGPQRPTAVFCLNDSLAYGVYAAARELGWTIPDDVSVLGFDDHPVSRLLTPPLSSYRWPLDILISSVVERTLAAMQERQSSDRVVLVATPMPRGSVAAPCPAIVP
jgi:LacI family transcriptional regulator